VIVAGRFNGNEEEVLVVIRCDLDQQRLTAFLNVIGDSSKAGSGEDTDLIQARVPGEDDSWFLALVEKGILVISPSRAYVREALAKAAGKQEPELNKRISALLQEVDPKQTAWLVVNDRGEDLAIRGGFRLTDDCKAEIVITAASEQAAKEQLEHVQADLKKAANYLEGLAQQSKALAPLVEAARAIQAVRDGKQITVRLELDSGRLGRLLEQAAQR
jgi:hypothetical protein